MMVSEPMIGAAPPPPHEISIRLKFKEAEFEAKGLPEDVKPYAVTFLTMVSNGNPEILVPRAEAKQLTVVEESDKPVFGDTGLSEKSIVNGSQDHSPANLLTFYLKYGWDATTEKSILKQREQLLLIGYFRITYDNVVSLHPEEYRQAYTELAELPVNEPANITARIAELFADGYLRKMGDGYLLTHKGTQAALKLISNESVE